MYDPTIGRWLSEDPIGFTAGDTNLYRYVHNAPTSVTDPSGLVDWIPFRVPAFRNPLEVLPQLLPAPVNDFLGNVGAGGLESAVPGAPLVANFPQPTTSAGRAGRVAGHVFGLGVGITEMIVGGSTAAGGGVVEVGTLGAATPIAVPAVGVGTVVVGVGVVTTGQSGALIINDLRAMFSSAGSGSTSNTPAQNIAEHLVRDHPERFGQDLPRIQREVQNVIDNATRTHTVQNGPLVGSRFFYRNGKTVVVRPSGQGTMVNDPRGAQFTRWIAQEP